MVARSVTSAATKNYVPTHSIYKMPLTDGIKQQEPTGHGRRLLRSFLKISLNQALFFLHGREQFGSPLALVGIFVAGDDALERRDR